MSPWTTSIPVPCLKVKSFQLISQLDTPWISSVCARTWNKLQTLDYIWQNNWIVATAWLHAGWHTSLFADCRDHSVHAPPNERQCYSVTSSLIGTAHTQNDPCDWIWFSRIHGLKRVLTAEKYYTELPEHHKDRIPHFRNNLRKLRKCIEANFEVIKLIIANTDHMFLNKDHGPVNVSDWHHSHEVFVAVLEVSW